MDPQNNTNTNTDSPSITSMGNESPQHPQISTTPYEAPPSMNPASSVLEPVGGVPNSAGMGAGKKILLGILGVFVLVILSAVGALYALAYHVIELKSYPELQQKVEFMVMEIPGTPKSARYLFYKAVTSQEMYTSNTFDISAAVTSTNAVSYLTLGNFDIAITGESDVKDPQNPVFSMNVSLMKDLNFDIKAKDKMVYFKVNKVPSTILASIGVPEEMITPMTNTWVSYDTTPLQTEARTYLEETTSETASLSQGDQVFTELSKYIDESVISSFIVTKGIDGGNDIYKLELNATPEMIDTIVSKIESEYAANNGFGSSVQSQKASDSLKNLDIEIWLDAKTYYVRRVASSFTINPQSSSDVVGAGAFGLGTPDLYSLLKSDIRVALVMKFSEFGKEVQVTAPSDAITFEEYMLRLTQAMISMYETNDYSQSFIALPDPQY